MYIIVNTSISIMAVLKSLSDNSNMSAILVLPFIAIFIVGDSPGSWHVESLFFFFLIEN